ncbi:MAG: DUF3795 domain-containing protein [bacterium]
MTDKDSEMRKEILETLAPCGLNCRKCFAFSQGEIKRKSRQLEKLLGDFNNYAKRFSEFLPVFYNYPSFKKLLDYFSNGDCSGCRNGMCKFPYCGVIRCYKEKGVDFCFQCEEFPCDKTNFNEDLHRRWIEMNMRMKEIGVESFFEKSKKLPRYK